MNDQRMLTTGFKFYFGAGMTFFAFAVLYGWTSGGVNWNLWPGKMGDLYFAMLGALTLGYKGAVGDHFGYAVLLGAAAVSFALAGFMVAFRDSDAKAVAEVAGTAEAPPLQPVATANFWGPLAAFAVAVMVLGVAISGWFVLAGIGLLGLVAVEWAMSAWADRATGDYRLNAALRARIMNPLEIPVAGVLVVALVGLGISRVYLAAPKLSATWLSIGIAALIFLTAILVAAVPRATKNVLVAVVVLGALAVLAGGIVGAALGERDFEKHETEQVNEGDGTATTAELPKGAITGFTKREETTTTAKAGS